MEFKHKSKRQLNRILKRNVESVIKVCEIESKICNIGENSVPSTSRDVFRDILESNENNFDIMNNECNTDNSDGTFLNNNTNVDISESYSFEDENSEDCLSTHEAHNNFQSYNEMESGSD